MRTSLRSLIGAAMLAGTLDLASIFALLMDKVGPERILQSVASGWLGKAAATGGARAATLGFVSHYGIMLIWAAIWAVISPRWGLARRKPYAAGALFGLMSFAAMNYVVVPLSAAARWPHWTPVMLAHALVVHIVFVGLVMAWFMPARGK